MSSGDFLKQSVVLFKKIKQMKDMNNENYYFWISDEQMNKMLLILIEINNFVLIKYLLGNLTSEFSFNKKIAVGLIAVLTKYGWDELEVSFESFALPIANRNDFLKNIHLVTVSFYIKMLY